MLQEEILIRLLQASTAAGFLFLLISCMSMEGVKWWLPPPIYLLSFTCLVTFLSTFFMRRYTFDLAVCTIVALAFSSFASAVHNYIKPIPDNRRDALNRRLLWLITPVVGILVSVWCIGVVYEGGIGYFQRFEYFFNRIVSNQDKMLTRQDSTEMKLSEFKAIAKSRDNATAEYREQLERHLQAIDHRLSDGSLRLHRLETEHQQQFKPAR